MALVNCRECGGQVSAQARSCPNCGVPFPAVAGWAGTGFEWRSARTVLGYPLIHIAIGRDSRGKRRVAKGVVALGQFALGLFTVAQFGVGLVFGLGQFVAGFAVVAQFAGGLALGFGQFATGYVAMGQFVLAYYGVAQFGLAKFLWSPGRRDAEAVTFFLSHWEAIKEFFTR